MGYRIIITEDFEKDLDSITEYISVTLDSKKSARTLIENVKKQITNIAQMPYMYPFYHEPRINGLGYRYFTVKNFLIFYRIDETEKTVYVSAMLYGRSNIEKEF